MSEHKGTPMPKEVIALLTEGWVEKNEQPCGWVKRIDGIYFRVYPAAINWRWQAFDSAGKMLFDSHLGGSVGEPDNGVPPSWLKGIGQ